MFQTQFSSDEREAICQTLGDSPFTVIQRYHIRHRAVNMVLHGIPSDIKALVIQSHSLMEEPTAFGTSISAIMDCLQEIQGWTCVNVALELADGLAELMKETIQRPIRLYNDVHYVLDHPIELQDLTVNELTTRFLTSADIGTVENAPVDGLNSDLGNYVAGGIVDKRVIALAHASAISEQYADVGVYTDENWRKHGISTHLSRLVMARLQADAYIPVWSTGADNLASQRVAEKLGMRRYGNRTYLIVEEKK